MRTGGSLPCPAPWWIGLNHLLQLLLRDWSNACKLCLSVCCSNILFLIILFIILLYSPVGSILNSFRGGLGGESYDFDVLACLDCWQSLLLPTSSSGESSFLLLEPRCTRSFAMFSFAWCSWFLSFAISRCARVQSFLSLATCESVPSELFCLPLIVNLGKSSLSLGFVSSNLASAYPIAFCVAEVSLVPSYRIWKLQNFFVISSWRLLMDWNLLNSNSRVCISSASSCASKFLIVAGHWPAVSITNLDQSLMARTYGFWISMKHCWITRSNANGPPLLSDSLSKYSAQRNLENSSCIFEFLGWWLQSECPRTCASWTLHFPHWKDQFHTLKHDQVRYPTAVVLISPIV